ncbi:Uncharacterised protein [Klebsiella pneumoniae]|uniref:Uncharacterized protein n=1 Tax=Klebsiella pneumoniae TaxID=573 RepID=A0A378AEC9_KLEPN|nr:Uncharacterised protein [Klebsiella pneumoniae]
MNLFERLMYRRLCNEQPADGGAAPAASEPSPLLRLSNLKQRNNQQQIQNLRQLMVINLSRLAISQLLLLNHRFQKNMN